jgi:hypothetical protein
MVKALLKDFLKKIDCIWNKVIFPFYQNYTFSSFVIPERFKKKISKIIVKNICGLNLIFY